MNKFCINCGTPVKDDETLCPSCAANQSVSNEKEKFSISVINPISATKHKFQVKDNVKISTIISKVLIKDNLPQTDALGNTAKYSLAYDVNSTALEDSLTLKDADIKANDILYIVCQSKIADIQKSDSIQQEYSPQKSLESASSNAKSFKGFVINLIFSCIGIFCGILSLIAGIISFGLPNGRSLDYAYYNGDAYTDLQHAVADAVTNLRVLIDNLIFALGFLFIIAGLTLICAFALNIVRIINQKKLT